MELLTIKTASLTLHGCAWGGGKVRGEISHTVESSVKVSGDRDLRSSYYLNPFLLCNLVLVTGPLNNFSHL